MKDNSLTLIGSGSTSNILVDNCIGSSDGTTSTCISHGFLCNCLLCKPVTYYSLPQVYEIQLRKVENGWILNKDGKEYVISKPEEILKFIEDKKKSK